MILWLDLPLNLAGLVFDVACLAVVARWPARTLPVTVLVGAASLLVCGVVAAALAHDLFALVRAWAWVLFLHAPLVLGGAAWLATTRTDRVVQAASGLLLAIVGVDAFFVEPRWLAVDHYTLVSEKVAAPLKIAVLSDIQSDHYGAWEARAVELALAERPDLILLPGDYVQVFPDEPERYAAEVEASRALWSRLNAPLGAYAVRGNVEGRDGWAGALFSGTPVTADEHQTTRALGPLSLTTLGFDDGFDPRLVVPGTDDFHVALAHGPDFALSPAVDADLLVAGHTHGGQVVIPGFGPPVTLSEVPRAWAAGGLHTLPDGRRHLVVSRGIGMERGYAPRLRFFCRPQLVVITVVPPR